MNLNPLFWVNELKEIGQRMKATGPINSILWCLTLPQHSSRPLRAFCLYPLCYSLIILSGVRVHVANCAERLFLRMARFTQCWHPPWLCPATLNYANYYNSLIFLFLFFQFSLLLQCHAHPIKQTKASTWQTFLRTVMGTFHLRLAAPETRGRVLHCCWSGPGCACLRPWPNRYNQLHATCVDCKYI